MRYYILILLAMFTFTASATSWTFTVYNMSNIPVFTTNTFKSAAVGKHKHLWIGSTNQGLYRFNGLTWQKATILTNHNILGAPTRVAAGIWVDEAKSAWSTHWPHTTPTLTGGGIGKFPTGSSTGTAIYPGLPSGSYATDRRCLCIGEDPGEIWVGVDRAVASGMGKSSYISKYSYGGTFFDSITAIDSPVSFSNEIRGVVVKMAQATKIIQQTNPIILKFCANVYT